MARMPDRKLGSMIDIDLIAAPSFRVDVRGPGFVVDAMNRHLAQLVDRDPHALLGLPLADLFGDEQSARLIEHYRVCIRTRSAVTIECSPRVAGAGLRWQVSVLPILDPDGSRVVALVNVVGPGPAERDRRETLARVALALDVLDGGFWHYAIVDRVLDASPRLIELMTGTAVDGVNWAEFVGSVHPDDIGLADIAGLVRGLQEAGIVEYRVRTADRGLRWVRCKRKLIRDADGRPDRVIGVVMDVTEDKQARTQIEQRATTDVLTKLLNRRGFEDCAELYLARAWSTGAGFGLLLIDLDRFKPINDAYGHAIGDAVLRTVARRIAREIRPTDIAARIGGDEFAVLVADIDGEPIGRLGERMVDTLAQPIQTGAGPVALGASVGMACAAGPSASIDDLFGRADAALYDIKRSGRGACKLAA